MSGNKDLVENGKNKLEVRCKHCESVVLKPLAAEFIVKQFDLPLPTSGDTQSLDEFYTVDDMFAFENVGFSHRVENFKYLACADCEFGPIGYQDISANKCYVSLERVKHVPMQAKADDGDK